MLTWIRGWLGGQTSAQSQPGSISPPPAGARIVSLRREGLSLRREGLSLRRAGLGTSQQRRRLARLGIRDVDDLLRCDLSRLARGGYLPASAVGVLRRWQWSIGMSRRVPAMRPLDWLLAGAVFHRGPAAIARANPRRLHEDITRFALTSHGTRILADHDVPTLDDVRGWVRSAARTTRTGPMNPVQPTRAIG